MKQYLISILILLSFSGCTDSSEETDSMMKHEENQQSTSVDTTRAHHGSQKTEIKPTHSKNENISDKKQDTAIKQQIKKRSVPSEVMVAVQSPSKEQPEPSITKSIQWTNQEVIITYKKKVYPEPGVGCSSSEEELTLRIPISKPKEKTVLNNEQLNSSKVKYSYSGGLYGENSIDLPPSGQITLSPLKSDQWEIDIDITFPIEKMGGFDQEQADKEFKISDIFN